MGARLRVGCIQMTCSDIKAENIEKANELVTRAGEQGADIVILPELWNTIGSADVYRANAESLTEGGETLAAMAGWAQQFNMTIVGGSICEKREGHDRLSNTCAVFAPTSGDVIAVYRKIHMFDVDVGGHAYRQSDVQEPGDEIVLIEDRGWTIGLSICYDLRFPELYRILALRGAMLMAIPSAFTLFTGRDHWELLLRARAVENQCYVAASNVWGKNGSGTENCGRSMIVDPWGLVVAQAQDEDAVVLAEIDRSAIHRVRRSLPALQNRQGRTYQWPAEEARPTDDEDLVGAATGRVHEN